jgi:hypothetical protein
LKHLRFTRRGFFAAAATPLLAATSWQPALVTRVAELDGPGLLRSYDVQGNSPFDRTQVNCAYTYDNAATGLAMLAAGNIEGAKSIADALAYAQANDRAWHDGRLRNAYHAGPAPHSGPYPLSGWWDDASNRWLEDGYQAGCATGVLAWAMMLWAALGAAYRIPAQRAADFIASNLKAPRGFAGGFIGFEPTPQRVTWVSTEHNIDLATAFAVIGRNAEAAHAAEFVAAMWQPAVGRFAMGLKPDGTLNDASAVDANLWPLLSAGAQPQWRAALPWVLAHHGVPAGAAIEGVDFNTDRDGIWLEGTAYVALAARRLGQKDLSARMMATLRANTSAGGLVYATTTPSLTTGLTTGLDTRDPNFLYFRRPHIGATAWAVLAQLGATPFPTP